MASKEYINPDGMYGATWQFNQAVRRMHICLLDQGVTTVAVFQLWPYSAIRALTSTTAMIG